MVETTNLQDLLPLGSIVNLKKGDGTKVLIIGRMTLTEDNGVKGFFEYSSVIYPTGIVDANQLLFFNHQDIDNIFHVGFKDRQEDQIQKQIKDTYTEYPRLSVDN